LILIYIGLIDILIGFRALIKLTYIVFINQLVIIIKRQSFLLIVFRNQRLIVKKVNIGLEIKLPYNLFIKLSRLTSFYSTIYLTVDLAMTVYLRLFVGIYIIHKLSNPLFQLILLLQIIVFFSLELLPFILNDIVQLILQLINLFFLLFNNTILFP